MREIRMFTFLRFIAIMSMFLVFQYARAEQTAGMYFQTSVSDNEDDSSPSSTKFFLERHGKKYALKKVSDENGIVTLLIRGKIPIGSYKIYGLDKKERLEGTSALDDAFEILGPTISSCQCESFAKNTIVTLSGMFFGIKPKVYFYYKAEEGGREYRKKCKILKSSYTYSDPYGKSKKTYPMDMETGVSQLQIKMPKLKTQAPVDPKFVVVSDSGEGTVQVSETENAGASNPRGALISYNYRDSVKADDVWNYLLDSMGGSWLERQLANALCKNTKLKNQSYQYDLDLFTIMYWTINGDGQSIEASGVVAVPRGLSTAPLLSFQHGTMLMKSEAPSMSNGAEMAFAVTYASAEGFVASIPDHAGLGVSAMPYSDLYHPYCQYAPIAYSDGDMLIALRSFLSKAYVDGKLETKISLNNATYLAGYSEGGYATLGLQRELEKNPDLYGIDSVTACGPMAGPYSLSGVMLSRLMSDKAFRVPYFAPYLLVTMNNDYKLYASPSDFLASPYDTTVAPLIDGYHESSAVDDAMPSVVKESLLPAIQTELEDKKGLFYDGLAKNDLINLPSPGWSPIAPVMMVHGKTDDCVLWENSEEALEYFQNTMGKTNISLRTLNSNALIDVASLAEPTHVLYAPYAMGEVWTWFHDLLSDSNSALPSTEEIETEGKASDYPL